MTDYRIRRLGHLGDGIAEGPVYVPGALPGEVVTGIPDGDHLKDVRIVTPSSDRVAPPLSSLQILWRLPDAAPVRFGPG